MTDDIIHDIFEHDYDGVTPIGFYLEEDIYSYLSPNIYSALSINEEGLSDHVPAVISSSIVNIASPEYWGL